MSNLAIYLFQYAHLFSNWDVVYTEAQINNDVFESYGVLYQPVHILEKP
jgi:hypothetical protein